MIDILFLILVYCIFSGVLWRSLERWTHFEQVFKVGQYWALWKRCREEWMRNHRLEWSSHKVSYYCNVRQVLDSNTMPSLLHMYLYINRVKVQMDMSAVTKTRRIRRTTITDQIASLGKNACIIHEEITWIHTTVNSYAYPSARWLGGLVHWHEHVECRWSPCLVVQDLEFSLQEQLKKDKVL